MVSVSDFVEATNQCSSGIITPEEWQELVIGEKRMYGETLKRVARWCQSLADNIVSDETNINTLDFSKERRKNQNIVRELNEKIRWMADHEYIMETIRDAVLCLDSIEIPEPIVVDKIGEKKYGVLFLADQHFGCEFNVGVNKYSPEIYYARMNNLLEQIKYDNRWMNIDRLGVYCLGDMVDGILRMSSIQKQKIPVVDACLKFAEHMANWLATVSKTLGVKIEFTLIGGNHDNIRLLQSRPTFDEESYAKIINEFIKIRLEDNPNIIIFGDNYDNECIELFGNHKMVISHSEHSNAFEYYESVYGNVDRIYCGHYHNYAVQSCGRRSDGVQKLLINVPSIVGTDPYAKKLRKNSCAGAYFEMFNNSGETMFSKIYNLDLTDSDES